MEISNGFIRSISGVWSNLKHITEILIEEDEIYNITAYFTDGQTYILAAYDSKEVAQMNLDFIMRIKI